MMTHIWVLFAVCVAVVPAAIPATRIVHIMDDIVTEGNLAFVTADQSGVGGVDLAKAAGPGRTGAMAAPTMGGMLTACGGSLL